MIQQKEARPAPSTFGDLCGGAASVATTHVRKKEEEASALMITLYFYRRIESYGYRLWRKRRPPLCGGTRRGILGSSFVLLGALLLSFVTPTAAGCH